jgi:hypothetical protein
MDKTLQITNDIAVQIPNTSYDTDQLLSKIKAQMSTLRAFNPKNIIAYKGWLFEYGEFQGQRWWVVVLGKNDYMYVTHEPMIETLSEASARLKT